MSDERWDDFTKVIRGWYSHIREWLVMFKDDTVMLEDDTKGLQGGATKKGEPKPCNKAGCTGHTLGANTGWKAAPS